MISRLFRVFAICAALAAAFADQPAASRFLITEPDDGLVAIDNLLSCAGRTIDMTMYELVDSTAEQLLADASRRGVAVRVILDQNLEHRNNQAAYNFLQQNGVRVVWAPPQFAATHQKSIVVDGVIAAIMTLNLTSRYYASTRDYAVLDTDPGDIAAMEQVFDADFSGLENGSAPGADLFWSPVNADTGLLQMIRSAKQSLQIEAEEMSATDIVNALVAAAAAGVRVEVVMTYDSTYAANLAKLAAAGAHVSTYDPDAALYIHAKVILADYGTPDAKAFIGSENFSVASLKRNRELGIVITEAGILQSLAGTLARDFRGGSPLP